MRSNIKPCSKFKCTDLDTCEYCYNGNCTGHGFNGYEHCGCDLCEYNKIVGPYIICTEEEPFIPPRPVEQVHEDIDYDDDIDYIINP